MEDTLDMQGCERCSKESRIETMRMMEDCWFCAECTAEWDQRFAACEHQWTPERGCNGDDGRSCARCGGFVSNEDMLVLFPQS